MKRIVCMCSQIAQRIKIENMFKCNHVTANISDFPDASWWVNWLAAYMTARGMSWMMIMSWVIGGSISALIQFADNMIHYGDVIMGTIVSQITSLMIVYSTVYSDTDQRKHQSPASLAFVRDRWILRTNSQLRGKYFHLTTSSCSGHGSGLPAGLTGPHMGHVQGSHTFSERKPKDFWRTYQGQSHIYQALSNLYLVYCKCVILW